jgi:hypothetical protein
MLMDSVALIALTLNLPDLQNKEHPLDNQTIQPG